MYFSSLLHGSRGPDCFWRMDCHLEWGHCFVRHSNGWCVQGELKMAGSALKTWYDKEFYPIPEIHQTLFDLVPYPLRYPRLPNCIPSHLHNCGSASYMENPCDGYACLPNLFPLVGQSLH